MQRIVIVAPAWVGDMVMAQSLVARLHQLHPEATVDLIAPPWTAPLGARMPGVGKTHVLESAHGRFDLGLRWRLGRALGAENYDLAIVLPRSLKAALPPFLARIGQRRGWRGEMRYGLLNDVRLLDAATWPRTVDQFLLLAEDDPQARPAPRDPVLTIDAAHGTALAQELGLSMGERPAVVFCPGAEYGPAKRWPASHFAGLAELLIQAGCQVWLLGSGNDQPIAAAIIGALKDSGSDRLIDLTGKTGLTDAVDLIGQAKAVVTNDSGLMHVAAATGRPLVALYGSSSPERTPPLSPKATVVEIELSCRPCFKRECPLGHLNCLTLIEPKTVFDALKPRLG